MVATTLARRPQGALADSLRRWACAACTGLASAVNVLVLALVAVMLLSLSGQVVMRYFLGKAPSWSEELAITCFGWSMLLAIALGVRNAIHVRMDLLVDRLPAGPRRWLDRATCMAIAAVGMFLGWTGVRYVADTAGATSAAIGYPISYLYASAPVCGALVAVFALERLLRAPVEG